MFCPRCGTPKEFDYQEFCRECGYNFKEEHSSNIQKEQYSSNIQKEQYSSNIQGGEYSSNIQQERYNPNFQQGGQYNPNYQQGGQYNPDFQQGGQCNPNYQQQPGNTVVEEGEKTKLVFLILWALLGGIGAHRFYAGDNAGGIIILACYIGSLFTFGISGIVGFVLLIIDVIKLFKNEYMDANGRPITKWS